MIVAQRPPRQLISRGMFRRLLFLTTWTVIWLYFGLDLFSRVLPHGSRIVRLVFESVPENGFVRTLLFFVVFLIAMVIFGTAIDYINNQPGNFFHRISDMEGMSRPFLLLGIAGIIVLLAAYEFDREEYQMTLLVALAAGTWLFCAIPAEWSILGFLAMIVDGFSRFMYRLPLIGRYFRFRRPPSGGYQARAGRTTGQSGTPTLFGSNAGREEPEAGETSVGPEEPLAGADRARAGEPAPPEPERGDNSAKPTAGSTDDPSTPVLHT